MSYIATGQREKVYTQSSGECHTNPRLAFSQKKGKITQKGINWALWEESLQLQSDKRIIIRTGAKEDENEPASEKWTWQLLPFI